MTSTKGHFHAKLLAAHEIVAKVARKTRVSVTIVIVVSVVQLVLDKIGVPYRKRKTTR